jgi:ribulose-phosphate 3-epimerase
MRDIKILPSILAADFTNLGADANAAMQAGGDIVHIDIMDGHFVPNLTFGPEIVKQLRKKMTQPFDVHLMVSPADSYLAAFADAGADVLCVHQEAGPHLHRTVQAIHALGKKAGVALNPGTPVSALEAVIDDLDMILVMSVNPGFGGQKFIPGALEKVRQARALAAGRDIIIEVDGGVTADNAGALAAAGADWLVAGSSVFKGGPAHYAQNIAALRASIADATGMRV